MTARTAERTQFLSGLLSYANPGYSADRNTAGGAGPCATEPAEQLKRRELRARRLRLLGR